MGGVLEKNSIDLSNAVLMSCVIDCKVFVVENAASLLNTILCNASEVIHNTIRS